MFSRKVNVLSVENDQFGVQQGRSRAPVVGCVTIPFPAHVDRVVSCSRLRGRTKWRPGHSLGGDGEFMQGRWNLAGQLAHAATGRERVGFADVV